MDKKSYFKKLMMITVLVFSLVAGFFSPTAATVSSAKTSKSVIKLSKKSVTLKNKKKYTLKLKNVPKKAKTTWVISKGKSYISLSSKKKTSVKIKAKKNGTAKVTAKVKLTKTKKTKKLVCTVKVKLPEVKPTEDPETTLPPHITPEGQAQLKVVNGVLQVSDLDNVYEVTIPEGVKEIPDEAFAFCHTLEKVTFPEGLEKIGKKAFNDCTRLDNVSFPSTLKTIGKEAFFECSSLKNVHLNDGLLSIGAGAFFQCKSIKNMEIPSSVNDIGDYCFAWCEGLVSMKINAPLTEIPREMFDNCKALENIKIPETVKKIGSHAFYTDANIKNLIIPQGVDEIGYGAFEECRIADQVINVKKIESRAFSAAQIANIKLGDRVESIGDYAFEGCGDSDKGCVIDIPASLTEMNDLSISDVNINEFKVAEGNPAFKSVDGVLFSADGKKLISFPSFKKVDNYTVPDGVEEICNKAMKGTRISQKLVIPESVKKIGEFAIGYSKAKEIQLSEGLKEIGINSFMGTTFEELSLPDSLTEIGDGAFSGMDKLKTIKLPESLKKIPFILFENDTSLASVRIPDSVEWIDPSAFSGCEKIKNFGDLILGENSNFSTKAGVLFDKSGKKLLAYPNTDLELEEELGTIEVPEGTTEIGDYAMQLRVKAVKIPDSVKKIGRFAFGYERGQTRKKDPGNDLMLPLFHMVASSQTAIDYAQEYTLDIVSEEDPDYFYKNELKIEEKSETEAENMKQISLKAGETEKMDAKGVVTDHYFFSADKNIATVDRYTGTIKAVAKGVTTITEVSGTLYFCLQVKVTDGPEPAHDDEFMIFKDEDSEAVDAWEKTYFRFNPSIWFCAVDYPAITTYSSNYYNAVTAPYYGKDSSTYKTFITDKYGEGNGEYYTSISVNLKHELSEAKLNDDILLFSGKGAKYGVDYITKDHGTTIESLLNSIGTTPTYPNVISTSLFRNVADGFSSGRMCAILEIEGRAEKVNGMMIRALSVFSGETELLLNQGMKFKIVDAGVKWFLSGIDQIVSVKPFIRMQIL